jgi:hypothetical protein
MLPSIAVSDDIDPLADVVTVLRQQVLYEMLQDYIDLVVRMSLQPVSNTDLLDEGFVLLGEIWVIPS